MQELLELLGEGFSLEMITTKVSLWGLLATLSVALLCAMVVYFTYRFFYPGVIYSANFNLLLVLVTLITALIIMTISANIVLSLGMVGALSIVRFRSAVKDPLDIGFLFLGIGAGLTAGAGLYLIAVCGTVAIALIYVLLRCFKKERQNFLLVVNYEPTAEEFVQETLKTVSARMKNKTFSQQEAELTLEIKLKKDNTSMLRRLTANPAVKSAVILEYSGEHTV